MAIELALTEVNAGIFELRLPIPFEDGLVNVFLFQDGDDADLLDCGMNSEESVETILRAVEEIGARRLRKLVVTHIHPDHYGAAGTLAGEGRADLYLHRLEVPMVHPRYLEIEQLVEEVGRYLQVNGVPDAEADFLKNASRGFRQFVKPALPQLQLDGTEVIEMGRRRLRVEWTPGHSPGHVCLFDLDSGVLFAGDQLLPNASPNIGLHPQSTPNPLDDYLAGLERLVGLAPSLVLPAHGRPFREPAGRAAELVVHHRRRKEQMVEVIGDGELNAWQVATAVWGVRENLHEMRMALQEGLAHLQSLSLEGRLEKRATPKAVTWRQAG